jgi:ABC-2 type transport system permease protein
MITISIMLVAIVLVVTGLGLTTVGVIPGVEEAWRILIYLIISVIYISFWLGVSILFSILFRSIATSALAALAVWIFFSFFISLGASVVANAVLPDMGDSSTESLLKKAKIVKAVTLISPMELYTNATSTIIDPMLKTTRSIVAMGPMERLSISRFSGPLSLGQSILVVLPYIITLIAVTAVCFAISYTVFMRQEIRSF